jgi:hypothetical protein
MQVSENEQKLILDYINESSDLYNDFIEFNKKFTQNMLFLKEKSRKIIELLENRQKINITDLVVPHTHVTEPLVEVMNVTESYIDTENEKNEATNDLTVDATVNNTINQVLDTSELDEETARVKLAELMKLDSFENDVEHEQSTISTTVEINNNDYSEKFSLKECKIVLNRVKSLKDKLEMKDDDDDDREVDNLCNIDHFLETITNQTPKNVSPNKKKQSSSNKNKRKSNEELLNDEGNDMESLYEDANDSEFGIVKDTDDEIDGKLF